ncbi:DUF3558 domain-containing protein [Amycolatopsis rubida]|uniref:DUF3558 domain-containing protein n=1 Tax=Amycolatopsis rubida TaxID=112413 RepID=A0A1I5CZD2_9PSEU|nr:DUF3558 domain-containing protein [Amycolatopsis rubida]SFN91991.1 Protein of unknown function [Amycolatopsis rubida]
MTKTIAVAAATGVLLLAATACSSNPGTPAPAASGTPSAPVSSGPQAPRVSNPLAVGKYEQDPCTVLTPAQATEILNSVRHSQSDGNAAPICNWFDADDSGLTIGFVPHQGGLSTVYENTATSSVGYFKVGPDIAGYPSAFFSNLDDRNRGGCQLAVGVTDDEAFTSSVILQKSSPSYADPCSLAVKAATAAVTTIKAGA